MNRLTNRMMTAMMILAVETPLVLAADQKQKGGELFIGDFADFFWSVLIFVLTLVVLRRFAWRPLLEILRRRETLIHDSMEMTLRDQAAAAERLKEYERRLERARQEASTLVEEGRRDAEVVRQRGDEEARRNAEALIERARREISMARDTALRDLYEQSAHLATDLAGQILQRKLSDEDQCRLIEEALQQMHGQSDSPY